MLNAAFFMNGPVVLCLKYQPAGPLEEILSAPQNPPRAAIRSECLFTGLVDWYAYCMGHFRSDTGAPESVAMLLTRTWIAEGGRRNSSVYPSGKRNRLGESAIKLLETSGIDMSPGAYCTIIFHSEFLALHMSLHRIDDALVEGVP